MEVQSTKPRVDVSSVKTKTHIANSPKFGPHRILPGRLSVSRAFGDIEAKTPILGGNPDVLISTPEIRSFQIDNN